MLLIINMLPPSSWGKIVDLQEVTFSLTFKEESLGEVLAKISEATNYKITVGEEWIDLLVTASLNDVTIYESLKLVLRDLNHAVISNDAEKKLTIFIYGAISPVKRQKNVALSDDLYTIDSPTSELQPADLHQNNPIIDPSVLGLPVPDTQPKKLIDPYVLGLPAPDLKRERAIIPSALGLPAPDSQQKKPIDPYALGLAAPDLQRKKKIDPYKLGLPVPYSLSAKFQQSIH
jgi:hypothetical protein